MNNHAVTDKENVRGLRNNDDDVVSAVFRRGGLNLGDLKDRGNVHIGNNLGGVCRPAGKLIFLGDNNGVAVLVGILVELFARLGRLGAVEDDFCAVFNVLVLLNDSAVFVIEVYGIGILLNALNNYDAVGKDVFNRILSVLFGENLIMVAAVRAVLDYRVRLTVRRVKEELEVEVSSAENRFCVQSLADFNREAGFGFERKCDVVTVQVNALNGNLRFVFAADVVFNVRNCVNAAGRGENRAVILYNNV